jgi:hypothetical protein
LVQKSHVLLYSSIIFVSCAPKDCLRSQRCYQNFSTIVQWEKCSVKKTEANPGITNIKVLISLIHKLIGRSRKERKIKEGTRDAAGIRKLLVEDQEAATTSRIMALSPYPLLSYLRAWPVQLLLLESHYCHSASN